MNERIRGFVFCSPKCVRAWATNELIAESNIQKAWIGFRYGSKHQPFICIRPMMFLVALNFSVGSARCLFRSCINNHDLIPKVAWWWTLSNKLCQLLKSAIDITLDVATFVSKLIWNEILFAVYLPFSIMEKIYSISPEGFLSRIEKLSHSTSPHSSFP